MLGNRIHSDYDPIDRRMKTKVESGSFLGALARGKTTAKVTSAFYNGAQSAVGNLVGKDRNMFSDIAVGMTPVGVAHDVLDAG